MALSPQSHEAFNNKKAEGKMASSIFASGMSDTHGDSTSSSSDVTLRTAGYHNKNRAMASLPVCAKVSLMTTMRSIRSDMSLCLSLL